MITEGQVFLSVNISSRAASAYSAVPIGSRRQSTPSPTVLGAHLQMKGLGYSPLLSLFLWKLLSGLKDLQQESLTRVIGKRQ